MFVSDFVTLILFVFAHALAASAPVILKNPVGAVAVADFPSGGPFTLARGYVYFYSPNGQEVQVHVDMSGLPKENGPFVYHIHDNAISNDDCETAGLHFNPYGATPDCDNQEDDSWCQVGDLSGKHGNINATCFSTSFGDPYLSLGESVSNIVGKSVVFHYADLTKFACASIQLADEEQIERFNDLKLHEKKSYEDTDSVLAPSNTSETATESIELDSDEHANDTNDTHEMNDMTNGNTNDTNSIWNSTKLAYESCSSEAQAASVHGGVGMVIGAVIGALL